MCTYTKIKRGQPVSKKKIYRELCLLFSIISIRLFSLSKPLSSISKFIICRLTLLPDKLIHSHGSPGQHHHHLGVLTEKRKNIFFSRFDFLFLSLSLTHSIRMSRHRIQKTLNRKLLLLLQSRLTP